MQVSIYNQSTFSFKHLSIMVSIISISNLCLEIIQVSKSDDYVLVLLWYKIFVSPYVIQSTFEVSEILIKWQNGRY